jgi:hypothetical protein
VGDGDDDGRDIAVTLIVAAVLLLVIRSKCL